jgi:hypothetical protein
VFRGSGGQTAAWTAQQRGKIDYEGVRLGYWTTIDWTTIDWTTIDANAAQ